ncbi:MAG: hypothetical protein RPU91_13840 [Candidatus Sedimenticola sp. (ex Thyasira tokunagai)]
MSITLPRSYFSAFCLVLVNDLVDAEFLLSTNVTDHHPDDTEEIAKAIGGALQLKNEVECLCRYLRNGELVARENHEDQWAEQCKVALQQLIKVQSTDLHSAWLKDEVPRIGVLIHVLNTHPDIKESEEVVMRESTDTLHQVEVS